MPGLHLGRFDFHGGLSTSVAYDNMVVFEPNGVSSGDFVWSGTPTLTIGTEGPNDRAFRLSYSPTLLHFMDHSDLDSVNHAGTLDLVFPFNRLTLSLSEMADVASVLISQAGGRATAESFTTTGRANYELGARTSMEGIFTYSHFELSGPSGAPAAGGTLAFPYTQYGGYQSGLPFSGGYPSGVPFGNNPFNSQFGTVLPVNAFLSSDVFGEQLFLDYHFSDKLSLGGGIALNQYVVESAPMQTSEGPTVRGSYLVTDKVSLNASAGVSLMQLGSDLPDILIETFSIGASYQVLQGTSLSLNGARTEQPSTGLAGQNFTSTSLTASVSQTFPHRTTATLSGTYSIADYYATQAGVASGQSDSIYSLRGDVTYSLSLHWNFGVFAEHDANGSGGNGFNYDHYTAGVRAGFIF